MIHKLRNKKIGIWGLGVVGKSVLKYIKNYTDKIQILDQKTSADIPVIIQTPESIIEFLEYNDIIIPSPGISLLPYQKYADKFIHEIDLFAPAYQGTTIAITGTLGKTTVTSFIHQCIPSSVTAGNIGYPMLNVLAEQPQPSTVVLELSSYQLQYAQDFAPDIAVWTNFYPNHLDHHATLGEYFQAKCMIFKHQKPYQDAIIPLDIFDHIQKTVNIASSIYLWTMQKPNTMPNHPIAYIHNNAIVLEHNQNIITLWDNIEKLPNTTFLQNWIVILMALHLHKTPLENLLDHVQKLQPEPHRRELVRSIDNVTVYNDSKSTVWQSTQSALESFKNKKVALIIGGLSKGTDRTPLFEYLQNKAVIIFIFGAESAILAQACEKYNMPYHQAASLENIVDICMKKKHLFDIVLFSPGGSSFDGFKNYQDRGEQFKKLIAQY